MEEDIIDELRNAIQEGRDSGIAEEFDVIKFLKYLKQRPNSLK